MRNRPRTDTVSTASPPVAHHFDDAQQQKQAVTLGMWLFLITELMMFGGLFTVYTVYRTVYGAGFAVASRHLDVLLGGLNTVVLICSSLTMALAVHAAQCGKKRGILLFLALTLLLGAVFLGVKVVEYVDKFKHQLVPGANFFLEDGTHQLAGQVFYSAYFVMTGTHAFHMIIGMGLMVWLCVKAQRNQFSPHHYTPLEFVGLYWHFVDIVWIFLFPLLYLIGRHH